MWEKRTIRAWSDYALFLILKIYFFWARYRKVTYFWRCGSIPLHSIPTSTRFFDLYIALRRKIVASTLMKWRCAGGADRDRLEGTTSWKGAIHHSGMHVWTSSVPLESTPITTRVIVRMMIRSCVKRRALFAALRAWRVRVHRFAPGVPGRGRRGGEWVWRYTPRIGIPAVGKP